jgi:hypothetical protein
LNGLSLAAAPLSTVGTIVLVVVGVVVLLVVLALWRLARAFRQLRAAERPGRQVSAQQAGGAPLTSFSRDGAPSDPLNVKITGTSGQLASAFTAAGWYRADEIDLVTSARISVDSILGRKYSTAPVSNLYLFGRKEDYAFERPGTSVRERDHVRFWDTGARGEDGRPIWVGGATRDIKVEISRKTHLPTHKISPDVDAERATVLDGLIESGWVIGEGWEANFGQPTQRQNSLGDAYQTDGRRAVLTLADVAVFTPLATHVRSPLLLRLARAGGRRLRWRLPKAGRERAAAHRAAHATHERAHTP